MTRRERLMATFRGSPVDRPPVSFYEIGGWRPDPDNSDPYNIYNAADWRPLLELAEAETDLIRMCGPERKPAADNPCEECFTNEAWEENGSRFSRNMVNVGGRKLTSLQRRDRNVATTWTLEHLLKDEDDVKAYLQLPDKVFHYEYDVKPLEEQQRDLGDAGLVMVDVDDPICSVASLFSMEDYTVFAMTEPELFHRLLEKHALSRQAMTEEVARAFPGRLWRICGSEYASEPYLPPHLYKEYVVRYTGPMVRAIQQHGGYARIHSHGRLRNILPLIASMGAVGLDPVEPPPQGDVGLAEVRAEYGEQFVLFGNIESCELESMESKAFEARVKQAIKDGTAGRGRGFVLMPSSAPYGRTVSKETLANYETMVRMAKSYS